MGQSCCSSEPSPQSTQGPLCKPEVPYFFLLFFREFGPGLGEGESSSGISDGGIRPAARLDHIPSPERRAPSGGLALRQLHTVPSERPVGGIRIPALWCPGTQRLPPAT